MLPDSTQAVLPLSRLTRLYDGLEQLEDMWDEDLSDSGIQNGLGVFLRLPKDASDKVRCVFKDDCEAEQSLSRDSVSLIQREEVRTFTVAQQTQIG